MCRVYDLGKLWRPNVPFRRRSSNTAILDQNISGWRTNPCFLDGYYDLPDKAHGDPPEDTEGNDHNVIIQDGIIRAVKPPWDTDVWLAIIDKNGPHLSECCGSIETVRGKLLGALVDGGRISTEDIQNIVCFLSEHQDHGGLEYSDNDRSPLSDIFRIWNRIEGRCAVYRDQVLKPLDINNPKDAMRIIRCCTIGALYGGLERSGDVEGDRFEASRSMILELHRMAPAVKTLYERMLELDPGPIAGYAIVDQLTGNVMQSSSGIAFYLRESFAREVLTSWESALPVPGAVPTKPCVLPARASVADGLVIGAGQGT